MKSLSSYLDSHLNENYTLQEVGMKLIPEHELRIRRRLESLQSRAPAVSSTSLKFTNEDNSIRGELTIRAATRSFKADFRGENPWMIYQSLEKKIDQQLLRWKKSRFLDESTIIPLLGQEYEFTGGFAK